MEFCPKCKSLLVPRKEEGKEILKCLGCGFAKKGDSGKDAGKIFTEEVDAPADIPIIDSEKNPYPKVDWKCSRCGAKEAYFWSMQLRRSDESETTFYRCIKCGKTWRRSG